MFLKRFQLTTSLIAIALLLTTGCNSIQSSIQETPSATPKSIKSSSVETTINAQAPERIDGTITLSFGFSTNSSDPRAIASEQFKREVEEKTNGSVKIEIFPDGQRGSDSELITNVIGGTLDLTVSSAGNFTGYAKNVGISALPFLFVSSEQAWKFMDSTLVSNINKDLLEYNIRVLAHFDNGFRCVTTKSKPINTPNDMIGLNIRTPENAVVTETMDALGAYPQTLPFSELYNTLQKGTLDAQENPIPVIYNSKLYEVQSYLSITNHSYDAMPFVISDVAWKQLTKKEQQILQEAAISAQNTDRNLINQQTKDYILKLQTECGMTINYPDLVAFKEKTRDVATYFSYDESILDSINSIIK